MTTKYYVLNKKGEKVYFFQHSVLDIPPIFYIPPNKDETFTLKDVNIESDKIEPFIPMIILSFIGMLVHPIGIIVGAFIGYFVGLNTNKQYEHEANEIRKNLNRLNKT